jgi:peptide/nickel transport system substrate-binding protein
MRKPRGRLGTALAVLVLVPGASATAGHAMGKEESATKPVLTIAQSLKYSSLDPAKDAVGNVAMFHQLSNDTLTHLNPDGSITGQLAAKFHYIGEGNKNFELTLRRNVRFSDGQPLTAAAVKTWLEYFAKAGGIASDIMGKFTVTTPGKWTVRLKLQSPCPIIPEILSQSQGWGYVSSPAAVAKPTALASASYGAGPYTLVASQSVAGDHLTYLPNKFYYDKSRIHFSKVVVRFIPDASAMLAAVQTGQVDYASGDASTADAAKKSVNVYATGGGYTGFFLRDRAGTVLKPLGDVRVRQALNYALDRKAITAAIAGKYGKPISQPLSTDGFDEKLRHAYAYNEARARSLLAAAGYANGFSVDVLTLPGGGDQLTQAAASYWAKIGVTAKITVATSLGDYIGKIFSGKFPINQLPQSSNPMWNFYTTNLKPGGILNLYNYNDPTANKLWLKAQRLLPAKAVPLWKQLSARVVAQAYLAPVIESGPIWYVSKKIRGFNPGNARFNYFSDPTGWTKS